MSKPFNFRTTAYFSGGIMFLGISMILPGIFISNIHILATLPFFLISLVVTTTHYGLAVDVSKKIYRQYVWMLGLKIGEWESFDKIEYIFIKKNRVGQTMHSMLTTRDVHTEVFDGFLRFSEKDKVHLATARTKVSLVKSLTIMATALGVNIVDYSTGAPTVIPTT